ncbi:ribosomal protein L19 [Venturia nashicola]|nr:ribosomal protein L19 [Venturia nashicola]
MAPSRAAFRPLGTLKTALRQCRAQKVQRRWQHSYQRDISGYEPEDGGDFIDVTATSTEAPAPAFEAIEDPFARRPRKDIPVFPPLPSTWAKCKDPVGAVTESQIKLLDPAGVRTRLFAKSNSEAAKVGDILLVRLKNGEPFAGVCMNIRRRGVDTGILLRNQLTRVGVEMWYKIYSPNITGIEVVQRREKKARRARLYFLRKPKHDMGSVEGVVRQYLRQRAQLGSSQSKRDAGYHQKKTNGKKRR